MALFWDKRSCHLCPSKFQTEFQFKGTASFLQLIPCVRARLDSGLVLVQVYPENLDGIGQVVGMPVYLLAAVPFLSVDRPFIAQPSLTLPCIWR